MSQYRISKATIDDLQRKISEREVEIEQQQTLESNVVNETIKASKHDLTDLLNDRVAIAQESLALKVKEATHQQDIKHQQLLFQLKDLDSRLGMCTVFHSFE